MIFGGWLTRVFAGLWRPMAASGSLWRTVWESPRPPINSYRQIIRCFDDSIVRCLDAGGWLELSAGGWLMLGQLCWRLA